MGLFTKKEIYMVLWSFEENRSSKYTTMVKAKDAAHAMLKVSEEHALPIYIYRAEKLVK